MRAVKGALATPFTRGIRSRKVHAWANGTSRRASGWAGESVVRSWDHPSHPLVSASSLQTCLGQGASLGEEAVLADSGRAGEITIRVGWVRSLDFLSILRDVLPLFQTYRSVKF